jgi:hypothetical protein
MRYRFLAAPGLLGCLALAACGDQESQTPAEPQFSHGAFPGCDFNFNSLISQFFVQPRQGTVLTLKQQMEAGHTGTPASLETVRTKGFDILANVDTAVSQGESSDSVTGASLANRVLACMFASSPPVPSQSLGTLGGFGVRSDGSAAVVADFSGVVKSAVKPAEESSWSTVLTGRTLIYGSQASSSPLSYHWSKIPPDPFNAPGAIVVLCDGGASSMVLHGTGVLAFGGSDCHGEFGALGSPVRNQGWGPFEIARRLVQLVSPASLHAAAVFTHGTSGKTTAFSHFTAGEITNAASVYVSPPLQTIQVNQVFPPIVVDVTASKCEVVSGVETCDDKPAVNQLVQLKVATQVSNKGTNVAVAGDTATTNSNGRATFDKFVIKKAGTYTIQAFFALGRPVTVNYATVGGIQAGGTGKKN